MRSILKPIKRLLLAAESYAAIPVTLAISLVRILAHYHALRKTQVVVKFEDGGFGHMIAAIDLSRRMFPSRCVFLVFFEYGRHNSKVAALWPDVVVIMLPISFGFLGHALGPNNIRWFRRFFPLFIRGLIHLAGKRQISFLNFGDVVAAIPASESLNSVIRRLPLGPGAGQNVESFGWALRYLNLQSRVPAPPVQLSPKWRRKVRQKLNGILALDGSREPPRLCCLYLRQKGAGSRYITSSRRDGSPLEYYLPAIRLLNGFHYQVLLIGDAPFKPSLYQEFGGMFVDSKNLGVDYELFALYAATEADIFIGEAGGASWLPGLNGIPRLLVNAFPFLLGLPNSWLYYKTVRDQAGKLVHYTRLFSNHAYDYELAGMTVHNNSPEEICSAVACFLEDISHGDKADPNGHIVAQLPDHVWVKQVKARLSPAWLKLFDNGLSEGVPTEDRS